MLAIIVLVVCMLAVSCVAVLVWTMQQDPPAPGTSASAAVSVASGAGYLPVEDLLKAGGGAWRVPGRIDWRKSAVVTFQGQPALKVFYGKDSGTSRHPGVGGLNFGTVPRGLPGTSAMMSFQVWFDNGWDFSGGGKLTGFEVGHGDSSGGRHSPTGASCRISFKEGGGAWMYVYPASDLQQVDPALSRTTGSGIGLFREQFPPGTFRVGHWNEVKVAVRMNTFDSGGRPNADGMSMVSINGRTATLTRMRWSRSKDLVITAYNFATFFGGSEPSVKDVTAYYRNFRMTSWD